MCGCQSLEERPVVAKFLVRDHSSKPFNLVFNRGSSYIFPRYFAVRLAFEHDQLRAAHVRNWGGLQHRVSNTALVWSYILFVPK